MNWLGLLPAEVQGVPLTTLLVVAVGLLVLVTRGLRGSTLSVAPSARGTTLAVRRPGWIARRRAKRGLRHPRGRIAVGCRSALSVIHLTLAELAGHGLAVGGPKSGKTTLLELLVEACAGRLPVIVIDPKGSPALAATVRAHGGQVWTLDGTLPADLLDPRPWQVPDLLLEAEDYSPEARAYRDAAHQRAQWAAWAVALQGRPMDLADLRRLLDRETLIRALEPYRDRDARVGEWVRRLEHQHGGIEDSGARGLDRALGILLDGPALRGSLGTGPDALRLEDVIDTRGLVLFSLDELTYPHATRKIAAWVLLAMGRLAHQLPEADDPQGPRALVLVDEVGALGSAARHLRALVGRAREAGLSVVMATQGLSDLEAVDRALVHQVLQDTAWQMAFRQGSPRDAQHMQALFGQDWVKDESWRSDGITTTRMVERPRVSIHEWMNGLEPGDAWLRIAPIDRGWCQERVRVALPRRAEQKATSETPLRKSVRNHVSGGQRGVSEAGVSDADRPARDMPKPRGELRPAPRGLPPIPPDCSPELLEKMGAGVVAKVEKRWASARRELGPCLVWTGPTQNDAGRYGWMYDAAIGRMDVSHRVVWRRAYGPIPTGPNGKTLEVDHKCDVTLCQRPDHLRLLTKGDNVKRRGPTRGPNRRDRDAEIRPQAGNNAAQRFVVALFERIDRPQLHAKTLNLDELIEMLTRFEVLNDKHHGRCWSPTKYAHGATTRGNDGVESVNCLVFDCDRVPPDPHRLEHVCWIGHTTHSHTPQAPRWRVVIPLARPVSAKRWAEVWRRARAALCPEADPACKDCSRAYWLPSRPASVAPETSYHPGPLLDPRTLPETGSHGDPGVAMGSLPPEQRTIARMSTKNARRAPTATDQRGEAYMAQVLDNLAGVASGSRNIALNKAAWKLGQWVAAGALDQARVEDALFAAAKRNGLVSDPKDGPRKTWATIRSGLSAGLQEPTRLDDKTRSRRQRSP